MRETAKDKGRLQHILSSIERVQEFTKGMSKEELVNDTFIYMPLYITCKLWERQFIN